MFGLTSAYLLFTCSLSRLFSQFDISVLKIRILELLRSMSVRRKYMSYANIFSFIYRLSVRIFLLSLNYGICLVINSHFTYG